MRRLPPRPVLDQNDEEHLALTKKLAEKTQEILDVPAGPDRVKRAREIYESSRQTQWFSPLVAILRALSGQGEFCMYCSANEPSQVEHFRPLSSFPQMALSYENYLWSCDICNRTHKGEKFPPDTGPGEPILNPLDDNVWDHFFLEDRFGRLIKRIDPGTNQPLPRAASTCDVVGIDRENVQIRRQGRYRTLHREIAWTLEEYQAGRILPGDLHAIIDEWRVHPSQPDVADFFLNGPGRARDPFRSLLLAAGEAVP